MVAPPSVLVTKMNGVIWRRVWIQGVSPLASRGEDIVWGSIDMCFWQECRRTPMLENSSRSCRVSFAIAYIKLTLISVEGSHRSRC